MKELFCCLPYSLSFSLHLFSLCCFLQSCNYLFHADVGVELTGAHVAGLSPVLAHVLLSQEELGTQVGHGHRTLNVAFISYEEKKLHFRKKREYLTSKK